ncbi:putative MFS multidrug transporter [Rhizodiscina lignyota]|uniref:MFS multidrug transporter n=1 Tax=Rhizodiscina lignyota TaxID=1504668 RepID=A0A9P4M4N1_9PEZI|nr:putative MFS multidrug transporter [Rhizodiscina lignyota]
MDELPEKIEASICDDIENASKESESSPQIAVVPPPLMDLDNGLVGWDSISDTANPQNWSKWKKTGLMVFMGAASTVSPLASSMVAPGLALTMDEFRVSSQILGSLSVTIYLIGFVIGPLFLGPMSEIFGRYPVLVSAGWFFNLWILGCALAPSIAGLIVMRILAGVGASAAMVVAPAVVADIYPLEMRASATATVVLAQCAGPALGPIIGGFISQGLGWRWLYWIILIPGVAVNAFMTGFMPESYAPTLLARKAKKLRKETGRSDLQPLLSRKMSRKQLLATSIVRPLKLLTKSPIAFLICAYASTVFGILYLFFTTIPTVFTETYGWKSSLTGLAYTPLGGGMIIALVVIMKTNDATVIKLAKKNNGNFEPEMRLATTVYYSIWLPISLFWYGWSTEKHVHWIVPIIGMIPFGFGMLGVFMPCQTYLVDAFSIYAASAVAAMRTSLSIYGTFLPLAGPSLFRSLGLGWGNTVLGFISLIMAPIPILFYKYGHIVRHKHPVSL